MKFTKAHENMLTYTTPDSVSSINAPKKLIVLLTNHEYIDLFSSSIFPIGACHWK